MDRPVSVQYHHAKIAGEKTCGTQERQPEPVHRGNGVFARRRNTLQRTGYTPRAPTILGSLIVVQSIPGVRLSTRPPLAPPPRSSRLFSSNNEPTTHHQLAGTLLLCQFWSVAGDFPEATGKCARRIWGETYRSRLGTLHAISEKTQPVASCRGRL